MMGINQTQAMKLAFFYASCLKAYAKNARVNCVMSQMGELLDCAGSVRAIRLCDFYKYIFSVINKFSIIF